MDARAVRGRGCGAANSYPPPPPSGDATEESGEERGRSGERSRPMRWRGVTGGADERWYPSREDADRFDGVGPNRGEAGAERVPPRRVVGGWRRWRRPVWPPGSGSTGSRGRVRAGTLCRVRRSRRFAEMKLKNGGNGRWKTAGGAVLVLSRRRAALRQRDLGTSQADNTRSPPKTRERAKGSPPERRRRSRWHACHPSGDAEGS